jgi:hypothetical protein
MKDILSMARQFVIRSLGRMFCTPSRHPINPEKWIEEFKLLSGRGHSHGRSFNRDQAHER